MVLSGYQNGSNKSRHYFEIIWTIFLLKACKLDHNGQSVQKYFGQTDIQTFSK